MNKATRLAPLGRTKYDDVSEHSSNISDLGYCYLYQGIDITLTQIYESVVDLKLLKRFH